MISLVNNAVSLFKSQLFQTNATVIETDDCLIIVDPTWLPNEITQIQAFVNQIKGKRPLYLLFTHADWDHIIGYGAFPEAIVIASQGLSDHADKQSVLDCIIQFDDAYYIDRPYELKFPKVDIKIHHDGQKLTIGKTTLTFYLANGHTNDGIFTIVEPLNIWLAGDYLSDVEFPFIYDNSSAYLHTLSKVDTILETKKIDLLIPGHGNFTDDLTEIRKRKNDGVNYIQALKKAILTNQDSDYLIERYQYLHVFRKFHEANISLIKKELSLKSFNDDKQI